MVCIVLPQHLTLDVNQTKKIAENHNIQIFLHL